MATPAERHRVEGNGHWVRPAGEPLGAVVRDVFDNTREILRDTVAIGALEVRRATLDVTLLLQGRQDVVEVNVQVPTIEPTPPTKLVPPRMTAAMASSSYDWPSCRPFAA